jgi:Xaa-Pro aminopeptidase
VSKRAAIAGRLKAVRRALVERGAAALFVPSSDPHLSEYLPSRWQARAWLSGFEGSAGHMAITRDRAALFVDSRYWEIAEQAVAQSGIEVVRVLRHEPQHEIWLCSALNAGDSVLVDGASIGVVLGEALRKGLASHAIELRFDADPLDGVWLDRPALPRAPVFEHPEGHAGRNRAEKLRLVRDRMQMSGATHHFLSSLDDLAWLLNLRGSDIDYNPFFIAHALLALDGAQLFIAGGKLGHAIEAALHADGVTLRDYGSAFAALSALPAGSRVMLDPARVVLAARAAVPDHAVVIETSNPSTLIKARKTDHEIAQIRETMIEEGVAFCRFYSQFEKSLATGRVWGEYEIHERIAAERARSPLFVTPSFASTAAFNANGALPHYSPRPDQQEQIRGDGLLLVDCGGQYLGGTTDVTRVWPIGQITNAMRRDVTLALKGLIALSRASFPRGTPAPALDAIARAPLWAEGIDYRHGTGHGIGYFLGVHEGPHYLGGPISPHSALESGVVLTIEPGVYRLEQWGVRIENVLVTVPRTDRGFGDFLGFETLTLCPIDTRCILPQMLDPAEVAWLDSYHATVRDRLAPRVDGEAWAWLRERTQPLCAQEPGN